MSMEHGSKLGKEYVKAVYCHPVYLTSLQSLEVTQTWLSDWTTREELLNKKTVNNRKDEQTKIKNMNIFDNI